MSILTNKERQLRLLQFLEEELLAEMTIFTNAELCRAIHELPTMSSRVMFFNALPPKKAKELIVEYLRQFPEEKQYLLKK